MVQDRTLVCRCGATMLAATGAPIAVATCHCESCRTAARQFEALGSAPIVGANGGVDYLLFRKERVSLRRGASNLADHRLRPDSATRRVVTTCCRSPLFVDFAPGYWLSLYRGGFAEPTPAPRLRTYTPRFFLRLIGAWAAMGFRRPKLRF